MGNYIINLSKHIGEGERKKVPINNPLLKNSLSKLRGGIYVYNNYKI